MSLDLELHLHLGVALDLAAVLEEAHAGAEEHDPLERQARRRVGLGGL